MKVNATDHDLFNAQKVTEVLEVVLLNIYVITNIDQTEQEAMSCTDRL